MGAGGGRRPGGVRPVPLLLLAAAASAALVAVLYGAALGFGFVYDDRPLVADNPAVGDWSRLPEALAHDLFHFSPGVRPSPFWRPLVTFSYWVDHAAGGGAPWAFHLTNLLVLAAAGAALAEVLRQLGAGPGGAVAGALVWLAHPLQVEGACNVAGRTDLLAALFLLLALAARSGGGAAAGTALACLSKEPGALAPALRAAWPRRWWAPALVVAAWLVLRAAVVAGVDAGPTADTASQAAGRMLDGLRAVLLADPPGPAATAAPALPPAVAWPALAVLVVGGAWIARRRRPLRVGGLLALGGLAATSGLASAHVRVGDTLLVLPWTGVVLAAAPLLARAGAWAALLALPLGWLGHGQVARWHDEVALWTDVLAERPDDPRIRLHLARVLVDRSPERALALLEEAEHPDPRVQREIQQVRGRALLRQGREEEALAALLAAASGEPETAWATAMACVLAAPRGLPEAGRACALALQVAGDDPDVLNAAALLALRAGRPDRAVEYLERASKIAPQRVEIQRNLRLVREAADGRRRAPTQGGATP